MSEYQVLQVSLSSDDAEFISKHLGHDIEIVRSFHTDEYLINPKQYVGVVQLPSGRILESRPKVAVENLFYMLAISVGAQWKPYQAQLDQISDVYELIASLFADEAEHLILDGLHRTYQVTEANLETVRGRIDFNENLRLNLVMRQRNFCRFDELTLDIPENQIIGQTAGLLNLWNFRDADLRFRLHRLSQRLSELTPTYFTSEVVDQFTYGRMTEKYRPIHRLCRLLLDGASLSEHAGANLAPAFLIDMNVLFERFISQVLTETVGQGFIVKEQLKLYLDETKKYVMYPDIGLKDRRNNIVVVADCKYKKLAESGSGNADMYQVLSYCTASRSNQGVLIYPLHEVNPLAPTRIENTNTVIRQLTIDLSGDTDELIVACSKLSQQIADLATESVEAAA